MEAMKEALHVTQPAKDASTDADPPLLGAQESSGTAGSARAKVASRLLELGSSTETLGNKAVLTSLDLTFPNESYSNGKRSIPFQATFAEDRGQRNTAPLYAEQVAADPDKELLSTVEDQRVVLADLDGDMQLPSLGGRERR